MTTIVVPQAHITAANDLLGQIANEIANWSHEECVEAIETLGGLAIVAGTAGHPVHVRVAELLVRLRELTRAVDAAVQHYIDELSGQEA